MHIFSNAAYAFVRSLGRRSPYILRPPGQIYQNQGTLVIGLPRECVFYAVFVTTMKSNIGIQNGMAKVQTLVSAELLACRSPTSHTRPPEPACLSTAADP